MGESQQPESNQEAPASGLYTLGGATLILVGGILLLVNRFSESALPPSIYYAAVGALVFGIIEWSLGRCTREAAWEWNKSLLFALALALLIRWPIAEPYRIPSGSMETTLHGDPNFGKGDRVFVNKFVYGVRYPFLNKRIWYGAAPERWDIVVFKSVEPDAEHPTLVKRIVGMPGEHIHITGGTVYINGEALEIPDFLPEGQTYTSGFSMKYGVREDVEFSEIPLGHYLVLGDNSANSRDGRYFGWLPNEHIVGRVASIWWPPPRWRDFTGFSHSLWWNGILLFLGVYLFVRFFVGRSWPTLNATEDGSDKVFVSYLPVGLRIPMTPWKLISWGAATRGDLVLYRPVGDATKNIDQLLGYVVAKSGDEVVIDGGKLLVNGAEQTDFPWLKGPIGELADGYHVYGKASKKKDKNVVPEGHLFLLTDYPKDDDSLDSRTMGFIPEKYVLGKAQFVWWPFKHFRKVR